MASCKPTTRVIPAACAWALFLSATGLFFVYPCRYLTFSYGIYVPIIQGVITFFVAANFALATFLNPGVIPKANTDEVRESDARAPLYKDIEIRGVRVRLKWCVTCQFYRPPRCTHCGICDSCIETFDHHCPWVNNCIGRRNYRYFFMFLFWLSIHMISIFSMCLLYVLDHMNTLSDQPTIITVAILGIVIVLFIPILGLTGYHVILISRGRTTNEQVTGKFHDVHNPYSRGCCKNILYNLCNTPFPSYKASRKHYPAHAVSVKRVKDDTKACAQEAVAYRNYGKTSEISQVFENSVPLETPASNQSQSKDCEPSPPPYHTSKNSLYLSLSQSGYMKQTPPPYQHVRNSRAITPPVSTMGNIRIDHSRRSLPPHNRLHASSPHSSAAQSIHTSAFHVQSGGAKTSVYNSGFRSNPTTPTYHHGTTSGKYSVVSGMLISPESCKPSGCHDQRSKSREFSTTSLGSTSFTGPEFFNSGKALDISDTCCLGNQTVDKLQEIANKTVMGGQCSEVSVREAFPKGCSSFPSSHGIAQHGVCQISNAHLSPPMNVIGNPCVDCQSINVSPHSSHTSVDQMISPDSSRTPGRRPLSFVKAMEMSDVLDESREESQTSDYFSDSIHSHRFAEVPVEAKNEVVMDSTGCEVSYEISV